MKKMTRLGKLRLAKYSINIGAYVTLATVGAFTGLPEGSALVIIRPETLSLNTNVVLPIVFCLFGLVAVLKDQLLGYFKFPKGVGVALALFALGFVAWLITYWLMAVTGLYLVLTIINTLYFNHGIDEELIARKAKLAEGRK